VRAEPEGVDGRPSKIIHGTPPLASRLSLFDLKPDFLAPTRAISMAARGGAGQGRALAAARVVLDGSSTLQAEARRADLLSLRQTLPIWCGARNT